MFSKFRESKYAKGVALLTGGSLLFQIIAPTAAMALTSGPSQPEVQSFEPVTTNQMVDPFTGDFTYNLPLFNLPGPDGGYPFNLAYHSGIGMEQEASWVGLGWGLNPGVINRDVVNLPDDFDGTALTNPVTGKDQITIKEDIKNNWTIAYSQGKNLEVYGADEGKGFSTSSEVKVYYNRYKGVGYAINRGRTGTTNMGNTNLSATVGLNLSLDSQEGIGASPSLFISSDYGKKYSKSIGVSTGYNSRRGLESVSLHLKGGQGFGIARRLQVGSVGGTSTLSFANTSFTPMINSPYSGENISISFKAGADILGGTISSHSRGSYESQHLKYKNEAVTYPGIGFMNMESYATAANELALGDFSRENDGMIHTTSKMLASPNLNHDNYSVVGQGIGNTFRPFRSDYGVIRDQAMSSKTYGGGISGEVGTPVAVPPFLHWGVDGTANWSKTQIKAWDAALDVIKSTIGFEDKAVNNDFEPYYFKSYGEHTADDLSLMDDKIKSESAVYFEIDKQGSGMNTEFKANGKLDGNHTIAAADSKRADRKAKGVNVQPITNETLLDESSNELLKEFDLSYYSGIPTTQYKKSDLVSYTSRSGRAANHIAGYTTLNNSGQKYVYALPAYNNTKKEVRFSVPDEDPDNKTVSIPMDGSDIDYKHAGSDNQYHEMTTPEYAHSYLLTSILGADYVDVDNNGPSDNDMGYWVKFNYVKASSAYKWRAPFTDANYQEGFETSAVDAMGAYLYGEKEIWHVATVETKTHIAEFEISSREDARGAYNELQNYIPTTKGEASYKLDKIHIYSKAERYPEGVFNSTAVPLKTVHMVYDYDLCGSVHNNNEGTVDNGLDASNPHYVTNANSQKGKLTLKKVYFTYQGNERGVLSPYVFDYHEGNSNENPIYNALSVDKWGNYKPNDVTEALAGNIDHPYVDQFNTSTAQHDQYAGVWNLKGITLPSGGRIDINYEADRYAYIQDEVAMQMTPITGVAGNGGTTIDCDKPSSNCLPSDRKVYFELEETLGSVPSGAPAQLAYIEDNYIKVGEEVYFKIYAELTNNDANLFEYVGGYAEVESAGVESTTIGWIQLAHPKIDDKISDYHPFQVAAWQHIRTNQPKLLYEIGNSKKDKEELGAQEAAAFGRSLISVWGDVGQIFRGVHDWMHNKGWGDVIDLDKSYLRLRTPDKEKIGGGCRVQQISITDNWDNSTTGEDAETYGQRYSYTKQENGQTISSGVAAYEPVIGGDEIALRKPIPYVLKTPLKTANNLYSELPVNENLYPGPQVGYSEVSVMSLTTYKESIGDTDYTGVTSTTGKTVHEFYTAKDFPVKTDYSKLNYALNNTKNKFDLWIPIPFIGEIQVNKLVATQGYSIVLNDMHGKLKKVSSYGQDDSGNFIEASALSSVEYIYNTKDNGELENDVDVILSDSPTDASAVIDTRSVGVDYDFTTDMRDSKTISQSAGLDVNVEVIVGGAIVTIWPSYSYRKKQAKTVVTNKVIHKSGILKKVVAYDGQSRVTTENVYFDPLTGEALLTKTTNNFDDNINNYAMPARWGYANMGAAYENLGLQFTGTTSVPVNGLSTITSINSTMLDKLQPGDEFIGHNAAGTYQRKFTYVDNHDGDIKFSVDGIVSAEAYTFEVIRSGKRNHLTAKAANYTTLGITPPTAGRTSGTCAVTRPTATAGDPDYTYGTVAQSFTERYLQNVIAATATTFTDNRIKDFRDYRADGTVDYSDFDSENPFESGRKGIWGMLKSYVYVDDRDQTAPVQLSQDGTFDDVALYNWDVNYGDICNDKWKATNKVTRVNPFSLELENKDILGRYSAALYGYDGRQTVAVAANARYEEIGFESFEEYEVDETINQFNLTTGNMDFYNSYSTTGGVDNDGTYDLYRKYDVLLGQGEIAILDVPFDEFPTIVSGRANIIAEADKDYPNSYEKEEVMTWSSWFNPEEVTGTGDPDYDGKTIITITEPGWINGAGSRVWSGSIGIPVEVEIPTITSNTSASIVGDKAHSGDRCLELEDNTATFVQNRLNIIEGKEYMFSAWISKVAPEGLSVKNSGVNVKFEYLDESGTLISASTEITTSADIKGKLIEGWQKLDFKFTPPATAKTVRLVFDPGNAEIVDSQSVTKAYFDDIRIFPNTGLMKTHVYDIQDFKLKATLDDNNYATFYYYDESGALFLIKKETEEGVKTIQESRSNIQEAF